MSFQTQTEVKSKPFDHPEPSPLPGHSRPPALWGTVCPPLSWPNHCGSHYKGRGSFLLWGRTLDVGASSHAPGLRPQPFGCQYLTEFTVGEGK